jgi:phosphoribosyl-ATP pyrophosphohydrolase
MDAKQDLTGADVLAHLGAVVAQRRDEGEPDKSYVAKLFAKGLDHILKKVGEEATEVVLAAKDGDPQKLVYEVADLWFHSIVALAALKVEPGQVLAELARREGLSGLEEFAARSRTPTSPPTAPSFQPPGQGG